ncbi:uncharacterized protein LOC123705326 [Colias croceus]|uniref:uncharacterized protein LOC123705326 n=1 Tax=Colias crocea TaxID=72248 RepID=UPI001E2818AA|nr:uncharacterized protein LOC123705326 [Colias croceus]CAG4955472.1 unnamed protein product [Colias eurytheme]
MMFKFVFMFALFMLAAATPTRKRSTTPVELVSVIELEEPCVRQGGLCLRIEDCQPGNLVQMRGVLCPNQRHLGVECCYA